MIFEKAPHTIEYYIVGDIKQKAVVVPFSKVAAFGETVPGQRNRMDWRKTATSEYFNIGEYPKNIQHAREMVQNFTFPQKLRDEAMNLSRELVGALEVEGNPRTIKNQAYGRFDARAMNRVVRDLQKGKFSREHTKPYTTRQRTAPKPPHVAIVGDASATSFWGSADYLPRLAALMLGVTWACEAVNCQVTTALTRDMLPRRYSNQDMDNLVYILNDDSTKMPLNDFAPLFHRDLFRGSNITIFASHPETIALLNKGASERNHEARDFSCSGGGEGYAWARSRDADIIITIGDMKISYNKDQAEKKLEENNLIQISAKTDLKTAVRDIASKLIKIKYDKVA